MAEKTPIRLVFTDGTPTGIAEYQSGDTIGNSYLTNSGFTLVDTSSTSTTISLGETLKIAGSGGVTATLSGDTLTIAVDGSIVTENSNDILTNKTIDSASNTLTLDLSEGTLTGTTAEFNSALSDANFVTQDGSGNVTISGNLTVSGTTTTINTETINLADNTILLNSNATGSASENGGIEIERGDDANKTLIWNETTDKWTVGSETFVAGTFEGALTGNVTGDVTGNADTATTLETARTIAGQSFNGSADITIASTDLSNTSDIVLLTSTQTLTNKTLTTPVISSISNTGTLTLPTSTDTLVGRDTTDTLTGKTINTASNTITVVEADISDLQSYILADSTDTLTNKTFDANGTGNSITNLEVADFASGVLDTDLTSVSASDNTLASAKAIKTYVDSQVTAQDLDFSADTGGALSIDLDSESLTVSGGTGISTSGATNTITVTLDDTAVSAGSYGSATEIPTFTVDAQGRLTAASTTSVATNLTVADDSSTNATISLLTDTLTVKGGTGLTSSIVQDTITFDLDDTAVTPGSYGSSTAVPQITVDQQGRITSLSTAAISTSFTLDADSGTPDTFNTGDTLTISGTANEIETAVTDNTITIGLPNDVTIGNDLTVTGNLTVNGTTTTVSTTNTTVSDQLLELGNGRTGSATGDAGIIIERGDDNNVFLGYDESEDEVVFGTGTFTGSSTGNLSITNANIRAADVTATGALDVSGASTLRGNVTLGVNSGDSTEDTITVNGRFISNLEPLNNITYDLGSPNRRWRDLYLSGNTIDIGGATISGDGTGQILISATGATLPTGSKVGEDSIASADAATGAAVRNVPFFTNAGGLVTAARSFKFSAGTTSTVFTQNQTFTLANGSNQTGVTLFEF